MHRVFEIYIHRGKREHQECPSTGPRCTHPICSSGILTPLSITSSVKVSWVLCLKNVFLSIFNYFLIFYFHYTGGVPSRGYSKGGAVPPNGVPNPRQMLNNVLKTRHPLQNNNQQNPSQPFMSQQQQIMWARGARPAVNRPVRISMYSSQPQTAPQPNPSPHFPSQGFICCYIWGYNFFHQ